MRSIRVGKKSQIVIPVDLREKLGIKEGDELLVSAEGGKLVLRRKPASYTEYMAGLGAEIWREIDTTEYMRKERAAWDRDSNGK